MDRFQIFAILRYGTKEEKEKLKEQLGQEKWEQNIKLWKSFGGKI